MFKKIGIVADHRGEKYKQVVADQLSKLGLESVYPSYSDAEDNDYPDVVAEAYKMYMDGAADGLIMLCGTGVGMCIAANKCQELRCVLANNAATAAFGRIHEDCNVLAMGVGYALPGSDLKVKLSTKDMQKIVKAFVTTPFEGGRHLRRVEKLKQMSKIKHSCKAKSATRE